MDPLQEIEALVGHDGRGPGTDAERRAARHLERRLADLGRDVEIEPVEVWPRWPLAHVIHALLAIVGTLVSVSTPAVGAALLLAAAVSAFGDLTGTFHVARRLTGRRASQNVVSREDSDRPGVLVLLAHYDAGRAGAVLARRAARFEPFLGAIVVALACSVLRLAGVEGAAVTAVQFGAAVILICSIPLLADIALAGAVPGANDNASGVATALRLAERHGDSLDHFDLWVALTGSQEAFAAGARAFVRRHRGLDRRRTAFVCVDEVGAGTVRWARREGPLLAPSYHSTLLELCQEIAEDDADDEDRYGARSTVSRAMSDAYPARRAGFPSVRVSCGPAPHHHRATDVPANVDPDALERAFGFCSELIELIDERIGPEIEYED